MTAEESGYRPRKHDHLVEPMFGGLGVEEPPAEEAGTAEPGPLRRLWRALLRFLRLSRQGSGP